MEIFLEVKKFWYGKPRSPPFRYCIPSWGFVFQEDNDLKHSSNLSRNFIKEKKAKNAQLYDMAAQSPELNPIELL